MTEQSETKPEAEAASGLPTQSPEDAMKRLAGIPKTPEELEAEREANEKERLEKGKVAAPVEATPAEQQVQPQQQPEEPAPNPTNP
jgi:hypothetical protein